MVEYSASIYEEMLAGHSDEEIMDLCGLDPEQFQEAKRFMLEARGLEERRRTPEDRFAEYMIAQKRNIRDLDDLTRNLDQKAQYNALVGAIRLRHDIQNRVIETGQTLGVIPKQAERKEIVGGIVLADMSDKDLRKEIVKSLAATDKMISRFGEGDFASTSIGELHYGPALPARKVVETTAEPPPVKTKRERRVSA